MAHLKKIRNSSMSLVKFGFHGVLIISGLVEAN